MKFCATCNATYPTEFNTCPKDQSVLRIASELMPGLIIRDKYQIVDKIGAGGMATVYRVKHLAFHEERAIKVVSSKLMDDPNFIKRFRTEALVSRKLQHPNAVRVDDLDTSEDGRLFMVMEYVAGHDLRSALQRGGPMSLDRTLHIAGQVASALAAAHQLGITHRDIKPDNILLISQPDGRDLVKVLDFGIAKVREGAMDLGGGYTATQTGMVVGTPQYISPEQAMGKSGDQIDGRADLYSLGVVVYEMLTGRQPFESETAMGLLLHHLQTAPTPAHLLRPELNISPAVSTVLMKAMEKDPAKRFQTAGEMLEALNAARPDLAQMAGAATNLITPTMMAAAAATPSPAAVPVAATPTTTPTIPAAASTAASAKTAPANAPVAPVDKTVAVARPKRTSPALRVTPRPVASEKGGGGKWIGIAAVVLIAIAGLAFLARQKRQPEAPAPVVQQAPVPSPSVAAPEVTPSPTPSAAATEEKPAEVVHKAKAVVSAKEPSATPAAAQPQPSPQPAEAAAETAQNTMTPEVARLLRMGKQQYENGKYGLAMNTFREALAIDPNNHWAQRGLDAAQKARQEKSEQVLQNDQNQGNQQNVPRWKRRQQN